MKMAHVTIQTKYLEESIKFYEDLFGLAVVTDLRPMGGKIVFLANGEDETCVELIENPENPYSGAGISMGFHVEDVESYHNELAEKGYNPSPIIRPNPNVGFFFVKDPNGVSIQFI